MTDDKRLRAGLLERTSAVASLRRELPPRNYRGDRPIEMDITPVKVRGEALHSIWWRGRQWAVTAHGLERLDGTYEIAADRLTENIETYGWPLHMGLKGWLDAEDFATAWLVALAMHGAGNVKPQAIRNAIKRGVLKE